MIPICKYLIQQVSSFLLVVIVAGGFVYSQTATVSGGNFGMGTYNFTVLQTLMEQVGSISICQVPPIDSNTVIILVMV